MNVTSQRSGGESTGPRLPIIDGGQPSCPLRARLRVTDGQVQPATTATAKPISVTGRPPVAMSGAP